MQILLVGYLFFTLVRMLYQIATGFLYVAPSTRRSHRGYRPLVSVIIPAWNEEVGVLKTIKSAMANTYQNLEIIVVDDGSTDSTRRRVQRYKRRFDRDGTLIRLISQGNAGKAAALNTGIATAAGELIITLDADSYLTPDSIQELVKAMANTDYAVAIGEIVVGNTGSLLGQIQHYEYLMSFHLKRAQHIFNSAYIFPGALTAFRSSILRETGSFAGYSSTEDLDISMRIKAKGYQVAYVDRAICITEGATSLRGLLNQRIRWRHGFIACSLRRREFAWSTKKGRYLSFVDYPLAIIGIIELLLYPFILALLLEQLIFHLAVPILILSYSLLVFVLLLLSGLRNEAKIPPKKALLMPVALSAIAVLEYIALLVSLYRILMQKETAWTVWRRTGAS